MKQLIYMFALLSTLLLVSCTDAGEDQEALTGNKIILDGSGSKTDMGGTITAYNWVQIEQEGVPMVHLYNRNSATPSFIAPVVKEKTDLKFKLTTTESYNCKNEEDSSCRHHISSKKMTVTILPSDSNTSTSTNSDTRESYSISVSGKITNASNSPISGTIVTANGKTVTTRSSGVYSQSNIPSSQRVVISATHPDYFNNSRIILPNVDSTFVQDIHLYQAAQVINFSPKEGGTASHNGASVTFEPGTTFVDTQKKIYKKNITIKLRYFTNDTNAFPGGYEGSNATETFPIKTHGFMYIVLAGENGEELFLSSNSNATLRFPITAGLVNEASTAFWIYDDTTGYWLEDTTARSENGNFVANVNTLGDYAVNTRAPESSLTLCVEDINGVALKGADILLSSPSWVSNKTQTASDGSVTLENVLAGELLTITVSKGDRTPQFTPAPILLEEGVPRDLSGSCIEISTPQERADAAAEAAKKDDEDNNTTTTKR